MGNFLRHSLAHLGSSQVEAIATILSFHLHRGETYQNQGWRLLLCEANTSGLCAAHARCLGRHQAGESLFLSCRSRCHPGGITIACFNLAPVTLFSLKGLPPPQSSYISGSQQHPSRSKTNAFGRRLPMAFRSSDSMKLHAWD